jgi:hypothetical protein
MMSIDDLNIEYYTGDHVPNPGGGSGDEWFDVADELVSVCLRHAPTWSGSIRPDVGEEESVSFVFEDTQWNDERYHYVSHTLPTAGLQAVAQSCTKWAVSCSYSAMSFRMCVKGLKSSRSQNSL